nr:uncharacterized protein LOC123746310 [Procambarus clarkii]
MKVMTLLLLGVTVAIAQYPQYLPPQYDPQSPPPQSQTYDNPERPSFQVQVETNSGEGPDAEGTYNIDFKGPGGTSRQEQGTLSGENGAAGAQGGYSFSFPDGTPGEMNFAVDSNDYK